jgi:hypothetical protein
MRDGAFGKIPAIGLRARIALWGVKRQGKEFGGI